MRENNKTSKSMIPEWIDIILTHLSDRGQTNCKLNVVKL